MYEEDRREEWMGLGIILTELRMSTWVENRTDSKLGMRVKSRIGWRSLFSKGTFQQQACVRNFLSQFNIELKENYNDKESKMKWLIMLEKLEGLYGIRSSLSDQVGWHMLTWVNDNPLPKSWDNFLMWVDGYDSERAMIDLTIKADNDKEADNNGFTSSGSAHNT